MLSLLSVWYFIIPPVHSFAIAQPGDIYSLGMFTVVSAVMAFSIAAQQAKSTAYNYARERVIRLEERARASDELRRWQDVINNAAFGLSLNDPRTDTIALVPTIGRARVMIQGWDARHPRGDRDYLDGGGTPAA